MERQQSTVRKRTRFVGTGLHSGKQVTLEICPAPANSGILFLRTDLPNAQPIAALVANVTSTDLCTTVGHAPNSVATIEHLMAAFAGLSIDNALVRVDAPEIPIMDGSSAPFIEKLLEVGTSFVGGTRKFFVVKEAFEVREGDRLMRVEPDACLSFRCDVEYESAAIGRQSLEVMFDRDNFLELSFSRTFCHAKEVEAMRRAGLALGGSLDNAIVVTDDRVLNPGGLRSENEFVRHKILDCIGDLALLGAPLIGRVTLVKNGHGLHVKFARELLARKSELLTVVEIGPFRSTKQVANEGHQELITAASHFG